MSGYPIRIQAHAKVNLHLDVVGRYPDGYHQLVTLFERLDLCDELTLTPTAGSRVKLQCEFPKLSPDQAAVPLDQSNLVVKAAEEYCQALGRPLGLAIRLIKRIPAGGGLGGGSSDAAATLRALQLVTDQALPEETLLKLAKGLGADVGFFLTDSPWALGQGRGDTLTPLAVEPRFWHLLVTPDFTIPTKDVYQALNLTAPGPDVKLTLCALRQENTAQVRDLLFNALEPTVERLYPAIRHVKTAIEMHGGLKRPLVSGSGSTVMALCSDQAEAETAAKQVAREFPSWRVFVSQTQ